MTTHVLQPTAAVTSPPNRPSNSCSSITTINGRRRRVMVVPDTGGEAWRIEHERRNSTWRETGREPITEVDLHVQEWSSKHDPSESDQRQSAVPDGGHMNRETFLTGQRHYCDICECPFDSLTTLASHDCRLQPEGTADPAHHLGIALTYPAQ